MQNIVLIIGNGASIDLLKHSKIDASTANLENFFSHGNLVPVPPSREKIGLLSKEHLPRLWDAGARPDLNQEASTAIFENLVTLASIEAKRIDRCKTYFAAESGLWAYQELLHFVRHKMLYYREALAGKLDYNGWIFKNFLERFLISNTGEVVLRSDVSISIISYNYDLFIEDGMSFYKIPYYLPLVDDRPAYPSIKIIKPHGSIDLCQKIPVKSPLSFPLKSLVFGNRSTSTEKIPPVDFNNIQPQVDLIPPSAMARDQMPNDDPFNWWHKSHQHALEACRSASHVIIWGLSYGVVDRPEINDLISVVPEEVMVHQINPKRPPLLTLILNTIFRKYKGGINHDYFSDFLSWLR